MEWMILPLKRYADFNGRSRRMEYWMFTLFSVLAMLALVLLIVGIGYLTGNLGAMESTGFSLFYALIGIGVLVWLGAFFIPSIAVSVRRLHDRDLSGWWYLGAMVGGMIPFIGPLISIAYLVFMFLPGTPGPNRFGPDPKDPAQVSVFA